MGEKGRNLGQVTETAAQAILPVAGFISGNLLQGWTLYSFVAAASSLVVVHVFFFFISAGLSFFPLIDPTMVFSLAFAFVQYSAILIVIYRVVPVIVRMLFFSITLSTVLVAALANRIIRRLRSHMFNEGKGRSTSSALPQRWGLVIVVFRRSSIILARRDFLLYPVSWALVVFGFFYYSYFYFLGSAVFPLFFVSISIAFYAIFSHLPQSKIFKLLRLVFFGGFGGWRLAMKSLLNDMTLVSSVGKIVFVVAFAVAALSGYLRLQFLESVKPFLINTTNDVFIANYIVSNRTGAIFVSPTGDFFYQTFDGNLRMDLPKPSTGSTRSW